MAGIIHVLDSETIDKIAAGEVVEKPSSVVKELVENAIDSGADKIAVEIKEGGISFIRVTDNGCGIAKEDLEPAFLRHATSKIQSAEDLNSISSLGFRGEALSSISAVSQVEMITKKQNNMLGTRVCCNGGVMEAPEDVGAPDGTTVLVRNLFYNTPVRKKFLHSSTTEGSYIFELMQHIALSHPEVSISFIQNGQTRFFTSGNNNLKDVIYRLYGKDTVQQILPVDADRDGIHIHGFIGKPVLGRATRNYETFFVNGRYVKSKVISSAVEEGYKTFLMQHKYPFAILHFTIDGEDIDVNVHPTKMEIRIMNPIPFCAFVKETVASVLNEVSLIRNYTDVDSEKDAIKAPNVSHAPEPFEKNRLKMETQNQAPLTDSEIAGVNRNLQKNTQNLQDIQSTSGIQRTPDIQRIPSVQAGSNTQAMQELQGAPDTQNTQSMQGVQNTQSMQPLQDMQNIVREQPDYQINKIIGNSIPKQTIITENYKTGDNIIKQEQTPVIKKAEQMELFSRALEEADDNTLTGLKIIGQVFETYWIVEFEDNIYFVDQHAAHEKVNYEEFVDKLNKKQNATQMLMPPLVISLSMTEMAIYHKYEDYFVKLGFEIEPFGGDELSMRGIPTDLYGTDAKDLFLTVLDELAEAPVRGTPDVILLKIASMSCKAAVKGNQKISYEEAKVLLKRLFSLENPYHCPHGRPTMFSMSKQEIDKKIKRIV
ncbi:MAG: DNA mismatch repair endonuclease MutL [Lachnospiraceae bacterium]|nr:DNA mismatch repair endonuclease MutL [Lachnospiraceae bacterium]MDD5854620.1 DNA mismatch repair endonuclease MutL [Lachnospiraceae bacterium]